MKSLLKYIYLLCAFSIIFVACSNDNKSSLNLEGDTKIESMTVSGYPVSIDQLAKALNVCVPIDMDLSTLRVDEIKLSDGATCDYPSGTKFNGSVPRAITVRNGNLVDTYTLIVKHDFVEFYSFELDGKYSGSIDNDAHTITVFVPLDAVVSQMLAVFTVNSGTEVTPASGSLLDFSSPVEFKAINNSASVTYTATVVKNDMSQDPKAFIGNAPSVDKLGAEAKAAATWMLENVPNSHFVYIQDIIDGAVKLDDYKMVWCHFDWTDWPGTLWDSRDQFNSYWLRGGAILASRDGARYINDVWRIAKDQQSPNNMFGGENYESLDHDLGFTVTGHETHYIYEGIDMEEGRILLKGAGATYSNRTLQWFVDWDGYGSMEKWNEKTGATALASSHDYDPNCVTIAEFIPYEALMGYQSGRVITIGTPSYEWFDPSNVSNPYRENMEKLTRNAINYLCQ